MRTPRVARSTVSYQAVPENPEDIRIKRFLLDEIYMVDRCLGSRRLVTVLKRDHGVTINRKRLQQLRREIGHESIWCKPRTSISDHGHRRYQRHPAGHLPVGSRSKPVEIPPAPADAQGPRGIAEFGQAGLQRQTNRAGEWLLGTREICSGIQALGESPSETLSAETS